LSVEAKAEDELMCTPAGYFPPAFLVSKGSIAACADMWKTASMGPLHSGGPQSENEVVRWTECPRLRAEEPGGRREREGRRLAHSRK